MPFHAANGVRLHYHVSGEGAPILWIQGLGADHSAWGGQVYHFRQSYSCVVFDNRDVGHSAQTDYPYTVVDMAEDAAALIEGLAISPVHVVGLSLGGVIGQELALRHPHLVRTLTLVASHARHDARGRALLDVWPDMYRKLGVVDFYRQALPWLYSYRFFEKPRAVPAFLRYVANHPQSADAFARQVASGRDHDTRERLSRLRVPALVIAGEEDVLVPMRLVRELAEAIPGAQLSVIPGAGHGVTVEQLALFNQVLGDFLADHGP